MSDCREGPASTARSVACPMDITSALTLRPPPAPGAAERPLVCGGLAGHPLDGVHDDDALLTRLRARRLAHLPPDALGCPVCGSHSCSPTCPWPMPPSCWLRYRWWDLTGVPSCCCPPGRTCAAPPRTCSAPRSARSAAHVWKQACCSLSPSLQPDISMRVVRRPPVPS